MASLVCCNDCQRPLVPPEQRLYPQTVLSCVRCRNVYLVNATAPRTVRFMGAPCPSCEQHLTDDGWPCDVPCGSGGPHTVCLEEVIHV